MTNLRLVYDCKEYSHNSSSWHLWYLTKEIKSYKPLETNSLQIYVKFLLIFFEPVTYCLIEVIEVMLLMVNNTQTSWLKSKEDTNKWRRIQCSWVTEDIVIYQFFPNWSIDLKQTQSKSYQTHSIDKQDHFKMYM